MRRGRKGRSEIRAPEEEAERREEEGGGADGDEGRGFFACYLLCSLSPGHKGRTYIGFTVNPRRRIKQHNGEMRSGAWRTKRGRPWEMILCIYGFPSNVTALQFEWAWQHPTESLAVRKAASSFKSLSGVANKIKLAYTMLLLPSWENLKLTVNFFSTKYMKYTSGCPKLPKQMRVSVCAMDELPCYVEGRSLGSSADDDEDEDQAASNIDANDPTLSDLSADGIRGDVNNFRRESSDDLFDRRAAEDFNHAVEDGHNAGRASSYGLYGLLSWGDHDDLRHPTNSDGSLNQTNNCSRTASSEAFRVDEWIQGSGNVASADGLLLSLKGNMIDLSTPPSCKIHSFSKSDRTCSEIVDLTDSPVIIQL